MSSRKSSLGPDSAYGTGIEDFTSSDGNSSPIQSKGDIDRSDDNAPSDESSSSEEDIISERNSVSNAEENTPQVGTDIPYGDLLEDYLSYKPDPSRVTTVEDRKSKGLVLGYIGDLYRSSLIIGYHCEGAVIARLEPRRGRFIHEDIPHIPSECRRKETMEGTRFHLTVHDIKAFGLVAWRVETEYEKDPTTVLRPQRDAWYPLTYIMIHWVDDISTWESRDNLRFYIGDKYKADVIIYRHAIVQEGDFKLSQTGKRPSYPQPSSRMKNSHWRNTNAYKEAHWSLKRAKKNTKIIDVREDICDVPSSDYSEGDGSQSDNHEDDEYDDPHSTSSRGEDQEFDGQGRNKSGDESDNDSSDNSSDKDSHEDDSISDDSSSSSDGNSADDLHGTGLHSWQKRVKAGEIPPRKIMKSLAKDDSKRAARIIREVKRNKNFKYGKMPEMGESSQNPINLDTPPGESSKNPINLDTPPKGSSKNPINLDTPPGESSKNPINLDTPPKKSSKKQKQAPVDLKRKPQSKKASKDGRLQSKQKSASRNIDLSRDSIQESKGKSSKKSRTVKKDKLKAPTIVNGYIPKKSISPGEGSSGAGRSRRQLAAGKSQSEPPPAQLKPFLNAFSERKAATPGPSKISLRDKSRDGKPMAKMLTTPASKDKEGELERNQSSAKRKSRARNNATGMAGDDKGKGPERSRSSSKGISEDRPNATTPVIDIKGKRPERSQSSAKERSKDRSYTPASAADAATPAKDAKDKRSERSRSSPKGRSRDRTDTTNQTSDMKGKSPERSRLSSNGKSRQTSKSRDLEEETPTLIGGWPSETAGNQTKQIGETPKTPSPPERQKKTKKTKRQVTPREHNLRSRKR